MLGCAVFRCVSPNYIGDPSRRRADRLGDLVCFACSHLWAFLQSDCWFSDRPLSARERFVRTEARGIFHCKKCGELARPYRKSRSRPGEASLTARGGCGGR